MRHLWLSIITALVFFVSVAVAQTTPSASDQQGTQGTTSASPSASSPSGAQNQSPEGTNSPSDMNSGRATGQNPGYGNPGMNQGTSEHKGAKGEKKLKGCVQSQGGQYMLETKSGKTIPLTGQDLSAHVGHEVAVHGAWSGSNEMSGASGTSGSMGNGGGHAFDVTSVDMISDTCGGGKHNKGGSGSMQQQQ
jgi:Protein of unknown function (DUF5818)